MKNLMKHYFSLIIISFVFSQGNYQILSAPSNFKDIFQIHEFYQSIDYAVFNSSLPSDINIFSVKVSSKTFNKKNSGIPYFITLKNIDYGTLRDSETNYQFNANESAIEFGVFKENYLQDIDFFFNIGYLKSSIDIFDSEAIYISCKGVLPILDDDEIIFGVDNIGTVTDSYSGSNISLPETTTLSYMINTKYPFSILFSYQNRLDLNEDIFYGTLHMEINPQLDAYIATNSNRSDLFYGDYIQELTAGLRIGFSYSSNSNIFNLGFQNLGAAGYSTSFSFSKSII
tara:strand:- start:225 stop:1082 length:858 start_codon:yes stop_codon:yes gene_type:complete